MEQDDYVYVRLQQHLDRQAVGFPATRSGAEIRILRHIFTPEEAGIASYLSYRLEPLQTVFEKVKHLLESPEELEKLLDRIQKKGGIESKVKNGKKHYCCSPPLLWKCTNFNWDDSPRNLSGISMNIPRITSSASNC